MRRIRTDQDSHFYPYRPNSRYFALLAKLFAPALPASAAGIRPVIAGIRLVIAGNRLVIAEIRPEIPVAVRIT